MKNLADLADFVDLADMCPTMEINTNISFEIPLGTVLICTGMNLFFPNSSFILTPFVISQRSRDQIKVKITNRADTQTVILPKFSVRLKMLSLSDLKEGKIELSKIIARNKPGETQFYYKTE